MVFSVFSKTVLKNSFQKQKPNMPFVLVFSVFFQNKKKKKNWEPNVFSLFSFSLFLRTENSFQKQKPNWPLMFYIQKSPKIRVSRSKEHYWFLMALFQHSNQEAKVIRDKAK